MPLRYTVFSMATKKPEVKKPVKKAAPAAAASAAAAFWRRYKTVILVALIGFMGGLLWLVSMRVVFAQPQETHYHANFMVYINGQREEFKEFTYYEEVAACTSAYADNPKGRVHMHDKVGDVIHVHDKRVTYGNFFQNIGWAVGPRYIANLTQVFQTNDQNKVVYILNGKQVDNIANTIIGNEDHLLVSYGVNNTNWQEQFDAIPSTAGEVNKYQDPATCSGLNGAGHNSFLTKLKHATFWP